MKGFVLQLVLLRAHATDDGCDASEVSILQRPPFYMDGSVVQESSDVNSGRTSGPEASPEEWFESCLIPPSQSEFLSLWVTTGLYADRPLWLSI